MQLTQGERMGREAARVRIGHLCFALILAAAPRASAAAAGDSSLIGTPPWLESSKGWEAVLAPLDEPGGRFIMEGRLLGPDGKTGIPGMTMFAHHADCARRLAPGHSDASGSETIDRGGTRPRCRRCVR